MRTEIQNNLARVCRQIADAAVKAGRAPESVRLIAVSKNHPAAAVQAAYNAGQRLFGENRPQELRDKRSGLPADCEWHMIGHLQSNKARMVVQTAAWIHSVNTVELVQRLDRIAGEEAEKAGEHRTLNNEHRISNTEHRTLNTEHRTLN